MFFFNITSWTDDQMLNSVLKFSQNATNQFFELVLQLFLLFIETFHLGGILFCSSASFQDGNVGIFLADGCQDGLLSEK